MMIVGRKYSIRIWRRFISSFCWLPVAAVIDHRIFCVHSGISPELTDLNQINNIQRPIEVTDQWLLCDLLWSCPSIDHIGWKDSNEGISYTYGEDIIEKFVNDNNFEYVLRSRQYVKDGFEFNFNK